MFYFQAGSRKNLVTFWVETVFTKLPPSIIYYVQRTSIASRLHWNTLYLNVKQVAWHRNRLISQFIF